MHEFAKGKGSIVDYKINIRAIIASFYCGTGAADIVRSNVIMGVPSYKSWERLYSNHSLKLCELINSVANGVIDTSLRGEIEATIREKLVQQDESYIEKAVKAYFQKITKTYLPISINAVFSPLYFLGNRISIYLPTFCLSIWIPYIIIYKSSSLR